MFVSGVILAAGSSSRLGRPKQLLELDGEPILQIVVRSALASRLREVILVLGAHAEEIAGAVGDLGQRIVENPDFREGQSTSLRIGLSAVASRADAVLFLLGDQPEVDPAVIDRVIEAFERTNRPIVQPVYGTTPGNPVLFARAVFPELLGVAGDQGARSLIRGRLEGVEQVTVSDGRPPSDVDTDEDYQALLQRWKRRIQRTLE
jgi:molybdenum cofactor cytidylyltransferase